MLAICSDLVSDNNNNNNNKQHTAGASESDAKQTESSEGRRVENLIMG